MTKEVIELPFGVIQLFKINNSSEMIVTDNFAHRPDRVLESIGLSSFANEMANNRASNTSPISMKQREKYILLDNLFLSYFRRA